MTKAKLATLMLVAVALRTFIVWALPFAVGDGDPNCAPDEGAHFVAVRELADGRMRTWPQVRSPETFHLPVQYAAQAVTFLLGRPLWNWPPAYRFGEFHPYALGYPFARLGSVVLGVLTVVALAGATAVWTRSETKGWIAGLAVALYPQHAFLSAYSNGDAMTIAGGAVLVLALARWVRAGEGAVGLAALGAAGGLVVLGRVNGYAVLPPTLAWVAWSLHRRRARAGSVLRAGIVAAVVAVPALAFNAVRHGGDPLGLLPYRDFMNTQWETTAPPPFAMRVFLVDFGRSSFALFRNMDLPISAGFYAGALALLIVGLVWSLRRLRGADATTRRGALWLAAAVSGSVALVAVYSRTVDFAPQGRYALLPTLLLVLVAVCAPGGSRSWLSRAWPVVCLSFLAAAALHGAWVIYAHPCLGS